MMRKTFYSITMYGIMIMFLIIAILLAVNACDVKPSPNMTSVQQTFIENKDNIQIVIDYMIGTECKNIYITTADKMFADLTWINIDNPIVCAAVSQLIESGVYIDITKRDNTIMLDQWRGLRDTGCGIAYSINGIDNPDIMFVTEIFPISNDGWFYYVYDYNRWRLGTHS